MTTETTGAYRPGDCVTVSNLGVTKGWKKHQGTITKVTKLRVYVQWDGLDHSREHKYWELLPLT